MPPAEGKGLFPKNMIAYLYLMAISEMLVHEKSYFPKGLYYDFVRGIHRRYRAVPRMTLGDPKSEKMKPWGGPKGAKGAKGEDE